MLVERAKQRRPRGPWPFELGNSTVERVVMSYTYRLLQTYSFNTYSVELSPLSVVAASSSVPSVASGESNTKTDSDLTKSNCK